MAHKNQFVITEKKRIKLLPMLVILILTIIVFEVPYIHLVVPPLLLLMTFIWLLLRNNPLVLNKELFYLVFFVSSLAFFDTFSPQSTIYKTLLYFCIISMYFSGLNNQEFNCSRSHDSDVVKKYLFTIVSCFTMYVTIILVINISSGWLMVSRDPLNFWTGSYRAATHYGTMLIFPVAYSSWALLNSKDLKIKLFSSFIMLIAVIMGLMSASRTILYMIPLLFLINYVLKITYNKWNLYRIISSLVVIATLILFSYTIFELNFLGIKSELISTQLGLRITTSESGGIFGDPRIFRASYVLVHFYEYIWGGGNFRTVVGSVHNTWLNAYDLGGIVPFFFLTLFTISNIKTVVVLSKDNYVTKSTKSLIFVIYIACLTQMFLEPVIESVPVFFILFIYLNGLISRFTYHVNLTNNSIRAVNNY